MEGKEMTKHKEMIEDPNRWPIWPILPLVKRDGSFACGYLHGDPPRDGRPIVVHLGNFYEKKEHPTKEYRDAVSVILDGWEVD